MAMSDQLGYVTLFLVLLVTALSYKLRWRDSSFLMLLSLALVPAIIGKLLSYLGPEPKAPVLLCIYSALALAALIWGLIDRHVEHING